MWLMLNDSFLSIVNKDCARDELLVRARRRGDIERIFPDASVSEFDRADYLFRAKVKKTAIVQAMTQEVHRIVYDNFKSSVDNKALHDAYMAVWTAMAKLQETPPYSGFMLTMRLEDEEGDRGATSLSAVIADIRRTPGRSRKRRGSK